MREILFRGKIKDCPDRPEREGRWIEGGYVHLSEFGNDPCDDSLIIEEKYDGDYYIDPDTLGQFTGLYDKNKKRIFEGDIIRFGDRNLLVWFNEEAFQFQARTAKTMPFNTYDIMLISSDWDNIDLGWIAAEAAIAGETTVVIIGNIYDNPELLEPHCINDKNEVLL